MDARNCPCCGQPLPPRKRKGLEPQVPMSLWDPDGVTLPPVNMRYLDKLTGPK
jgi:hypothetical protein